MAFLQFKKKLKGMFDRTPSPEKITKFEELAAGVLGKYAIDAAGIREHRKELEQHMTQLGELLGKSSPKEFPEIEKATEQELLNYQHELMQQIQDYQSIVALVKKLIQMEDFEIVQDLKIPLETFETFIQFVYDALKGTKIDNDLAVRIKNSLDALKEIYEHLSTTIIRYVQHELSVYQTNTVGNDSLVSDVNLQQHLIQKTVNKRELNAAVTGIIGEIGNLHRSMEHAREDKTGVDAKIVEALRTFENQFGSLASYCEQRVKASDALIQEGIKLQAKKITELQQLREKVKTFEQKVIDAQKNAEEKPELKQAASTAKKLEQEAEKALRKADQEIVKVEKKDLKALKKERRWSSGILSRLRRTSGKMVKVSAVIALWTMLDASYVSDKVKFDLLHQANAIGIAWRSVDEGFAKHYGPDDYRYKIVHRAIGWIGEGKVVGSRSQVRTSRPDLVEDYQVFDCITYINDVLKENLPGYKPVSQIDKAIAQAKKAGWEIYFVTRDPDNHSGAVKATGRQVLDTVVNRGKYPFVGGIKNHIIGEDASKTFQDMLKGRIGLVSFNFGYHSALVLDGKLVNAHWEGTGGATVEGIWDFNSYMARPGKDRYEMAVVALAPQ